jgi:hypothetical protein
MAKLAMVGHEGLVVPSWYVAEEMGYEQPATEKEFEKVAAQDVRDIFQAHRPEVTPAMKARSGIDLVRDRLREKKASHAKGAEIIKDVTPSQFGGKALPAMTDQRPDMPCEVLDQLGKGDLSEALTTPTTMGMILKPREFQRITIIHLGKRPLADKLDNEGQVFSPTEETDTSVPIGAGHFSSALKKLLMPMLEERSCLEPIARRRIVKVTITKPEGQDQDENLDFAEKTPFLQKISAAYNGYLDRIGDCLQDAEEVVNGNPDLWETVHRSGLADGFEKTGAGLMGLGRLPGGRVNPSIVLGAVGGGLALSRYAAWKREKARMGAGPPVGAISDLIADNPKALMFLAGMGALHQQGSSLPGRLVRGLTAAARPAGAG